MAHRHTLSLILVAATLAGCGPSPKERTIRNPETGEKATVTTGQGIAAPRNMPAYAPLYPGAVVESSVDGVSASADGGQRGGMVSFRTSAAPAKVADFYRGRFDASSLKDRSETNISGSIILGAASAGGGGEGVQVSIVPAEDGGGSVVTLIYNHGG
ncbi:MAG: hypothetical protein GC145_17055 [Caulobacter sp.]|nr:hypothetical protein [Caulobacter sp.]